MPRHPQRYTSLPEKYYHTKKAPTSFNAEASLKTAATYLLRREWELAPLAGAREDIQSSLYGPARPLTRGRADSHIYEESLWS